MTVKLRLRRMGKKKQPTYRVVAADVRSPRDGRFIEIVGTYDPRSEPSEVRIDNDKAVAWLIKGARPTDRVRKLLEISGAWEQFTGAPPASPDKRTGTAPKASKAARASKARKAGQATGKAARVADEAAKDETSSKNETSSTAATGDEDVSVDDGETASDDTQAGTSASAGEAAE